jgi:hypothetical protein
VDARIGDEFRRTCEQNAAALATAIAAV